MANTAATGYAVGDDIFDILLPGSPLAGNGPDFEWESLADVVGLDEYVPSPATQAPTISHTGGFEHRNTTDCPITKSESVDDMFDALDAFLETEIRMDSTLCQSPNESSCWTAATPVAAKLPASTPPAAQPTFSCSSSGTVEAASPCATGSPVRSPFAGVGDIATASTPAAQSAGVIAAAVSAVKAASAPVSAESSKPIPRWKIYHMQQRQELLAPKQPAAPTSSTGSADTTTAATAFAATAGAAVMATGNGGASPVSASAVTGITVPACRSNSVTSSFTGGLVVTSLAAPAAVAADQLLLLNAWQQQQQLQLMQQQQATHMLSVKRPVAMTDFGMPKAKRSRTSAAGNVAAQHLYGLTAEPSQQLLQLQALQRQLQAQIQQTYQQQVEQYQQQQIQALHQQLHMRLQVQQQPQAYLPLRGGSAKLTCP